jgi:hypothetical protein
MLDWVVYEGLIETGKFTQQLREPLAQSPSKETVVLFDLQPCKPTAHTNIQLGCTLSLLASRVLGSGGTAMS